MNNQNIVVKNKQNQTCKNPQTNPLSKRFPNQGAVPAPNGSSLVAEHNFCAEPLSL